MKSINISLRALSSPLSLLSIGLLLLNDHVLKVYYPSALTGKISDFTGLFFFPILLTILLSIPLESVKLRIKQIAFIAYAITLLWFVLIKTSPPINILTTDFLSWLLGYPTQIILDPTDLIALLSLWPSWKLLRKNSAKVTTTPKRAYFFAGLAVFAAMATSFIYIPPVEKVIGYDNQVYAFGRNLVGKPNTDYAVSDDGGYTWQGIIEENVPEEVIAYFEEPIELPKKVCLTSGSANCYLINGKAQIREIKESEQFWSVAWEIPSGRHPLIKRMRFQDMQGLIPLDIAIASNEQSHYVVVAMGEQGVLIKNPNGQWERVAVASSKPEPIPLFVESINESFRVLQFEIGILILFSNLTLLAFTYRFVNRVMRADEYFHEKPEEKKLVQKPLSIINRIPVLIYSAIAVTIVFPSLSSTPRIEVFLGHFFLILLFSLGAIWTWTWLINKTSLRKETWQLSIISFAVAIVFPIIVTIPFVLWTFGTIFDYNHALIISIVLFVAILIPGFRLANQVASALPEEPDITP